MHRRALLGALTAAAATAATSCARRSSDGRTVATLWFSYGGKNREVLLELVARFNAAQAKHRVETTYQGDYFEALAKVRTALAAGVAPTFTHVVGEVVPYLARAGVLEPLAGYEGADALGLVPELAQEGAFSGGGSRPLVGVPFNRSTPIMLYDAAALDRVGAAPPTTWDELRALAARFVRGGTEFGFEVPISWWFWVAMVGQAGGAIVEGDGTVSLGGEAGVRALAFWQDLVHRDRSMRPPPGRDYNAWQATNQDFLSRRVPLIWTSTAFLRYLEETARFPVRAAPLPRDVRASVPTGGTMFVLLRSAPEAEKLAAWAFLRFMCETEQTIEWATRTGYLPVTTRAIEALRARGFYAAHPNDDVALRQLPAVQPWPWSPELFRIQREVVEPRLEDAVLSGRDARAVLDEARLAAKDET